MSVVKVNKVSTTQILDGAPSVYGFVVSVHSASGGFNFIKTINLDTAILSTEDAAKVTAFIDLVNTQLAR